MNRVTSNYFERWSWMSLYLWTITIVNILRTLKDVLASTAGRHYLIHETLSCGIVYDSTFGVASNFFYGEESICLWWIMATVAIKLIHPKLAPCRSVCSVQGSCRHGRYRTIIVWNRFRGKITDKWSRAQAVESQQIFSEKSSLLGLRAESPGWTVPKTGSIYILYSEQLELIRKVLGKEFQTKNVLRLFLFCVLLRWTSV